MNTKDNFYIYLISNVKTYSETNSATKFRTFLPQNLNLEGEWEVGLSEIRYTANWFSIENRCGMVLYDTDDNKSVITVQPGVYKSYLDLIKELNIVISKLDVFTKHEYSYLKFHYDVRTHRIEAHKNFSLSDKPDNKSFKVIFDEEFKRIFPGIDDLDFSDLTKKSTGPPRFITEYDDLYVYTNIVKPLVVGNSFSNILRIVNVPHELKYNQHVLNKFKDIHYHDVPLNNIRDVEIDLRDVYGKPILFQPGAITRVSLHFRRKK